MSIPADSTVILKPHSEITSESERQVGELAAMRRMLIVSEGTFSLSFAVYNIVRLRDELVKQLMGEYPGIACVRLPSATSDILEEVRDQVSIVAKENPTAIFVLDLEGLLTPSERAEQQLRSLNASRDLWEAFHCPVVFWLAEHAATLVASRAVDFWRYRSHVFEFAAPPEITTSMTASHFPGYDMIVGMPYEEKLFRRAELERRIADAGDPPSEKMLPHVLNWVYELAVLQEIFSDWPAAELTLQTALTLVEREYGIDSSNFATGLNNLAQLLHSTNRLAEAEPLYHHALSIEEEYSGAEHPAVASCLTNLAMLLMDTKRFEEAEPIMRRALAIDEQYFGSEHHSVARDMNNLAGLLLSTNRLVEAESLMRQVLAIDEKFYGSGHPYVARDLNNLAGLFMDTNRYKEAEPMLRRALAIDERIYGAKHPKVSRDLNNLVGLLMNTNRLVEAEPMLGRALAILVSNLTDQHPKTILVKSNYQKLLTKLGMSDAEIEERIETAIATKGPFTPIAPEVERLIGPVEPVL